VSAQRAAEESRMWNDARSGSIGTTTVRERKWSGAARTVATDRPRPPQE